MRNTESKKHENPLGCHSRAGGNPEGLQRARLDSRLRGNDELSASQGWLTECEFVLSTKEDAVNRVNRVAREKRSCKRDPQIRRSEEWIAFFVK
jgi:hypothetical protein